MRKVLEELRREVVRAMFHIQHNRLGEAEQVLRRALAASNVENKLVTTSITGRRELPKENES